MSTVSVLVLVTYFPLIRTLCDPKPFVQDTYLDAHVYDIRKAPSLMDCVATCSAHSHCESVGFEPHSMECHRHVLKSSSAPDDLVPNAGWIHVDVNMWSESGLSPCSRVTCDVDKECIVSRTRTPICIPVVAMSTVEAAETPGCPHPPPPVGNAIVSDGMQMVGSVRNYTCQPGFVDISADWVTTTCLADLTWSHAHLNCSGLWIRKEIPATDYINNVRLTHETLKSIYINFSIIFKVKTCHDANFNAGKLNVQGVDIIVFGGSRNRHTWIKGCPRVYTPDLLSCKAYRPFWVTFRGYNISAGKGERVGEREITRCSYPNYEAILDLRINNHINNAGSWLFRKRN